MKPGRAPRDGLLSKSAAALRLGMSRDGVRKVDHHLQPIQDTEGQWWYDERQVEAYRLQRDAKLEKLPIDHFESPASAKAFELFENDRSQAEVVIALRLSTAAVKKLWSDWCEMSEEGQRAKHRAELRAIEYEAEKARVKADGYRDYNEFRIREKELTLETAKEYAKAAKYKAEVTGNERQYPGREKPKP